MSEKFLFLDTETTGLSNPRLVTLAYCIEGEAMINYGMFKPAVSIEPGASAANHITNDMVKNLPLFYGSADWEKLQGLLDTHTLVAHNVSYDARVLQNEGLRVGRVFDTCAAAKQTILTAQNHQLQYLRYFLDLKCHAQAHNAFGDVVVLKALFYRLKELAPHLFPQPSPIPDQVAMSV